MIELILHDMLKQLKQYTPWAIITGIMVMVGLCVLQSIISKEPIGKTFVCNRRRYVLIYVLYVYLYLVVSITYISRESDSKMGVNLKLFSTLTQNIHYMKVYIENVILFIPFGFLLPLIWNKFYNFITCIGAGLIFILIIEVSQYFSQRGYFEMDDIITNLFGLMIGFIAVYGCRVILRSLRSITK